VARCLFLAALLLNFWAPLFARSHTHLPHGTGCAYLIEASLTDYRIYLSVITFRLSPPPTRLQPPGIQLTHLPCDAGDDLTSVERQRLEIPWRRFRGIFERSASAATSQFSPPSRCTLLNYSTVDDLQVRYAISFTTFQVVMLVNLSTI
jgi:hypothetical protein